MLRMIGYTEPEPGEMDFDPSIYGLHYLHGSLEHIDPFGTSYGPEYRKWVTDDGASLKLACNIRPAHGRPLNGKPTPRETYGCNWILCDQIEAACHARPSRVDDLCIMPWSACALEVPISQELPRYWGEELNDLMRASRTLLTSGIGHNDHELNGPTRPMHAACDCSDCW